MNDASTAAWLLIGIVVAVLVPAALALRTVTYELPRIHASNPTPYGYTTSLLIYLVPIGALTTWFFRCHPAGSFRRRAFFRTVALLAPAGFLLDLVFGNLFFTFPNPDATLQLFLPGYSFERHALVLDLPVEEFVFYVSGFVAILLVYAWCNEVWVPAYGVADYGDTSRHPPYVIQLHYASLITGALLILLAFAYKKMLAPITPERDYRDGLPLYFVFLVAAAVLPSLLLFRSARPFINWRAFSIALLWVLLTSLLWEATLASPFGWWHYRYQMMMGLHVKAWSGLPVEAVLLWVAVTFTTTIVYETIKVMLHMDKPLGEMLLGRRDRTALRG